MKNHSRRRSDQARKLVDEAAARKLVLLVDHTFVYTTAVRKIRELIASGQLGEIYYYDAVRVNLGLFQHDVNVIWDLAIHDLSIMDYVLPAKPVAISATGISHVPGQPENVAYITLFFASAQIAHVHVNWLTPVKVRHTLIGGSEKMILYDDLEPSEKLKVYDKGINVTPGPEDVYKMLVSYRLGRHVGATARQHRSATNRSAAFHRLHRDTTSSRKRMDQQGCAW